MWLSPWSPLRSYIPYNLASTALSCATSTCLLCCSSAIFWSVFADPSCNLRSIFSISFLNNIAVIMMSILKVTARGENWVKVFKNVMLKQVMELPSFPLMWLKGVSKLPTQYWVWPTYIVTKGNCTIPSPAWTWCFWWLSSSFYHDPVTLINGPHDSCNCVQDKNKENSHFLKYLLRRGSHSTSN